MALTPRAGRSIGSFVTRAAAVAILVPAAAPAGAASTGADRLWRARRFLCVRRRRAAL